LLLLLTGVLPLAFGVWAGQVGIPAWADAAFLLLVLVALSITLCRSIGTPSSGSRNGSAQHHHPATWWLDHVIRIRPPVAVGLAGADADSQARRVGRPRLVALGVADDAGLQLAMFFLAPVLLLPLFNEFTPLPAGTLRGPVARLGADAPAFAPALSLSWTAASARCHSNAFFTGLGRFRRIRSVRHAGAASSPSRI